MDGTRPAKITVEIGGRVFTRDLAEELAFETDHEGLNQALSEGPAKFAFWAMLEVQARALVEILENQKASLHATLYGQYEKTLVRADNDGKRAKPTVDAIKAAIQLTPEYAQALDKLRKANEALGQLTVARQAMVQRKDSVLAVASNYRAALDAHMYDQLKATRDRIQAARGGR